MLKQKKKLIWKYFCLHRRGEGGAGSCDSPWTRNKFLKRQVFLSLISLVQLLPHWVTAGGGLGRAGARRMSSHCPWLGHPGLGSAGQRCRCVVVWGSASLCPGTPGGTEQLPTAESCDLRLKRSCCASVCSFPSSLDPQAVLRGCSGGEWHLISFLGVFSFSLLPN